MSENNLKKTTDREATITQLGFLGEKIIASLLRKQGLVVEESLNMYDRHKDMTVDGKTVEVKTQVPFLTENAFSFRESQLKKCMQADIVYFISVPFRDDKYSGCIFEMDPKKVQVRKKITKDKRTMCLINREQEGMKIIHTITEKEILGQLKKLSSSQW